jgi:transposase-like protein
MVVHHTPICGGGSRFMARRSTRRLHSEVKRKSSTWHMEQTFVHIAGKWVYLFRAVDSHGQTVELSSTFPRRVTARLPSSSYIGHWPIPTISRSWSLRETDCGVIRRRFVNCRPTVMCRNGVVNGRVATAIIESDHRHFKRRVRAMQGPRTAATGWPVIQGIAAAHMIRKGQVLGITRRNPHGQAWVFGTVLGLE